MGADNGRRPADRRPSLALTGDLLGTLVTFRGADQLGIKADVNGRRSSSPPCLHYRLSR